MVSPGSTMIWYLRAPVNICWMNKLVQIREIQELKRELVPHLAQSSYNSRKGCVNFWATVKGVRWSGHMMGFPGLCSNLRSENKKFFISWHACKRVLMPCSLLLSLCMNIRVCRCCKFLVPPATGPSLVTTVSHMLYAFPRLRYQRPYTSHDYDVSAITVCCLEMGGFLGLFWRGTSQLQHYRLFIFILGHAKSIDFKIYSKCNMLGM